MITKIIRDQYTATIGIECHVQLKTQTKLFTSIQNDARNAQPNTLISHIDMGMPGSLPVLNKGAVELAALTAFALHTSPAKYSKFDRKHYFYPDLPLGYQITQFDQPIIIGGYVHIRVNDADKKIRITRAHLEADAGKSSHPEGSDYSLVDLNRVGTPLLEIVSEPDMHTPAEARAYANELYLIVKYAGVSDADLFHGNMRFDVNVSISKSDQLGTRTETKNLNSFRSVEKASEYEINRQIELLEKGKTVVQETRGWDDTKQRTFSQRGKEQAHDYRYMPDPDLPPVVLDDDFIHKIKAKLPIMPFQWREKLASLGLDSSQTAILIESEADSPDVSYLPILENSLSNTSYAKQLANWFVNVEIPERNKVDNKIQLPTDEKNLMYKDIYRLLHDNKLSSSNAKNLITDILSHQTIPKDISTYAEQQGLIQVSDVSELDEIVRDVLSKNAQAALDVQNGETKAIGYLVGQVMKQSLGKANPSIAQELIKKQLEL